MPALLLWIQKAGSIFGAGKPDSGAAELKMSEQQ